ncbi:DnaJ domain protein [Aspergillus stella-maris]|uniref:DnaJ domain protein n=1 Tax=Aspergillus stella-maris TaxID=1810926 RepID=UPI003CCD2734
MASSSMQTTMNCYVILGIPPDASIKDIDSAYRRLALKRHPDKADGDNAGVEFQKINEAVEILRDPTTRAAHDNALRQIRSIRRPYTKEEVLFSSPDYSGWRPSGMNRYSPHFSRKDRYTFSFGESVHMNPESAESRDEIARCEQARKEEAEDKAEAEAMAERVRMAAAAKEKEREREREKKENEKKVRQRWKMVWNPEAENFKAGEYRQPYAGETNNEPQESEWWAGARPHDEGCGEPEASAAATQGTAVEAETDYEIETEAKANFTAESTHDAQSQTGDETTIEAETTSTRGLDAGTKFNATPYASDSESDTEYEIDPVVIIEPGPEYHAEFDISSIIEEWTKAHAAKERQDTETNTETDVDSTTAEKASICSEVQNADQESGESIYYDFSDAAASQPTYNESEAYHSFPSEHDGLESLIPNLTISGSASASETDNSASSMWHDVPEFDEANVYPYLRPFVPYFSNKLADKAGRYTKDDFQGELKGMVLETYCGWLESVRSTIPGAVESKPSNVAASGLSASECHHLGYWKKALGKESCGQCGLWKPIYTLACPGCGIERCARCKFDEGRLDLG